MARLARLAVPGWPHHLVQRAHAGQVIVRDDEDRARLLVILREVARESGVAIHAYALFDDHLHLLATPREAQALSRMMQALGRRYVAVFNRRHQRSGGLWAARFRATVLEPARYLLPCMSFVELHPVRAGLVGSPGDYRWSSCAHHLGRRVDPLVADHALFWALGNTPFEREAAYRRLLEDGLGEELLRALTEATHKSWALGSQAFLAELDKLAGRRLAPLPRGRPRRRAAVDPGASA